ncbi:hypothetical protein [Phormidium sp. CCY1219]|uniref:hypothetical protein n=1 Tax=Phormidium sp. CCY1219 TaxID=2886104 RepID=UPI002D1EB141|nr:hypothetical protein [Phormidium sp. CCY1219]MEB3828059.1 hypothetical protein [Phormidium sp. CCY1219]
MRVTLPRLCLILNADRLGLHGASFIADLDWLLPRSPWCEKTELSPRAIALPPDSRSLFLLTPPLL